MTLLLDTHAWIWGMFEAPDLSATARQAIATAERRLLSPVSLYEVGQKVGLGKWPALEPHVAHLVHRLAEDDVALGPLTAEIALRAGLYDWPHRDPFDRVIAATAQVMGLAVVSADARLDAVPGGLHRIW